MQDRFSGPRRIGALTRIRVTGMRDFYLVQNGSSAPVKVWLLRDGLRCECGHVACEHVDSLRMCGFVEAQFEDEEPKAA